MNRSQKGYIASAGRATEAKGSKKSLIKYNVLTENLFWKGFMSSVPCRIEIINHFWKRLSIETLGCCSWSKRFCRVYRLDSANNRGQKSLHRDLVCKKLENVSFIEGYGFGSLGNLGQMSCRDIYVNWKVCALLVWQTLWHQFLGELRSYMVYCFGCVCIKAYTFVKISKMSPYHIMLRFLVNRTIICTLESHFLLVNALYKVLGESLVIRKIYTL